MPVVAALCLLLLPSVGAALEIDGDITAGLEYQDNATLSETDPREDTIRRVGGSLNANEESRLLFMNVGAEVGYEDYARDTYNDRFSTNLLGRFSWRAVPGLFEWQLEGARRDVRDDPTAPSTPDNLDQTTVYWTGPEITPRLSRVDRFQLGGRVGEVRADGDADDSQRYEAHTRWLHRLGRGERLSVNFEGLGVRYKTDIVNEDFNRYDAYVNATSVTQVQEFQADIGYSVLDRDQSEDLGRYIAGLLLRRQLNSDSTLWFSLVHKFTDSAARLLAASQTPVWVELPSTAAGADIVYERRHEIFYRLESGFTDIEFRAFYLDEDYETSPFDRSITGGSVDTFYSPSVFLTFSLLFEYEEQDYRDIERQDELAAARLSTQYRLGRHVSATAGVRHEELSSNIDGESYDSNTAFVGLRYAWGN